MEAGRCFLSDGGERGPVTHLPDKGAKRRLRRSPRRQCFGRRGADVQRETFHSAIIRRSARGRNFVKGAAPIRKEKKRGRPRRMQHAAEASEGRSRSQEWVQGPDEEAGPRARSRGAKKGRPRFVPSGAARIIDHRGGLSRSVRAPRERDYTHVGTRLRCLDITRN